MLEWWIDLNRWLKVGIALLFIALGAAELIFAYRFRTWTWGIGFTLLAAAILIGPSDSEKNGYHF